MGSIPRGQTADGGAPARVAETFRLEYGRVVASVLRIVRDIDAAEEIVQEAFARALDHWPAGGPPERPGAWLLTTARRRALDHLRRARRAGAHADALAYESALDAIDEGPDVADPEEIPDDRLRLIFTCCHPGLPADSRVALTLRLVGGLSTVEIARAFLVPEPTIAQRIVRAKKTLTEKQVPFEVPGPSELADRLASVLEVIYLIFNEGYTATAGDDWMRPGLCEDALRLGRILAELMPREPEVHGLAALMEIQASRLRARTGAGGEPILLLDQNRALWDRLLIERGLNALQRAERLVENGGEHGKYALQAAIAACHARAPTADQTDWPCIVALYGELGRVTSSPVVELNRAVAVSMASGPQAGLDVVDALIDEPALRDYHLLPSVRGDLLKKLGRVDEARREFERAASMTRNTRERTLLLERASACERP